MDKTTATGSTNRKIFSVIGFFILVLSFAGCGKKEGTELYHRFPDKAWARFNFLSFEIPVQQPKSVNIFLFARFDKGFQPDSLSFNMIMNTPSGEERIKAYTMDVKSASGQFEIACTNDSCQGEVLLKKELNLSKSGILKIEIENLMPRLATEGILGVGIRMEPSGK
jgi:gliding motility-associated lipoprotein GldH